MATLFLLLINSIATLPPTLLAAPHPAASPSSSSSSTSAAVIIDELIRELACTTAAGGRFRTDADALALASTDFGTNVSAPGARPAAVFYPSTEADIAALLRASNARASPFPVSARGCGHSTRGQATAPGGVVVDMASLARGGGGSSPAARLAVSVDGRYVDAGGEQLWVDVLHAALAHGLTPRSWTDYLHLTVGGTLSNAGISGQAFRHGPQISNVLELDVITGTGEMVTCSKDKGADLFDAVLGGLGQFGIITRARIPLVPAPARARWVRLLYTDAAALTGDQERLIDERGGGALAGLMDYVEGSVLTDFQGLIGSWRSQPPSSFFSEADAARVAELAKEAGGVLYCLEGAVYYGGASDTSAADVDKSVEVLLRELRHARGFAFVQDVSYVGFLDRVRAGELKLRDAGLWDVPHPWLNLFLPRSRILDFAAGVFHGVLLRRQGGGGGGGGGPVLVYPMNRGRWDAETSAVFPREEEVFYTVGILRSAVAGGEEVRRMEEQNAEVGRFCAGAGIPCTQYLPHYATQAEWAATHFGPGRWDAFAQRKRKYDPSAILSRGQRIFSHPLAPACA
ncbi:hypothetical protein U9M48_021111 [Paspalum notatum var. saurae]|uniref:cytokinin dehydrogenase n=1 Tax=Paspalum notatum var. saurae TaxID=547442 RepID=A0AAQ3TJQ3_PASNO